MASVDEIMRKYGDKIDYDLGMYKKKRPSTSKEYETFRKEILGKNLTFYESVCNRSEKIVGIRTKKRDKIQKSIDAVHLKITPEGAASAATFFSLLFSILAVIFGVVFTLIAGFSIGVLFLIVLFILIAIVMMFPLTNIPIYLADRWRMMASNQMVLCVLYIMMYMRHTSNLEHAVRFAADHVGLPLSLDFRKIIWDVETGKYSTIKLALDDYLENWMEDAPEFVESMHLIESSLMEGAEDRRVALLEKSLDVMLDGTYNKMLHFSHELRNPVQMLHMLGVVLPILGLVIFPLVGSLLGGSGTLKAYILFGIYNILLPLLVFILGLKILSKRPVGYSTGEILPQAAIKKLKKIRLPGGVEISPLWIASGFILAFLIIGFSPLIIHAISPSFDFSIAKTADLDFLDYKNEKGGDCTPDMDCFGPFGVGATLIGLLIPLGLGLGLGWYFIVKTKKLMAIKKETQELENEFSSALFQLGNRIGDGVPAEAAFGDVARSTKGSKTSEFFGMVYSNIMKNGLTLQQALFDPKVGAVYKFPSKLIESSMKILLETSKKGVSIVSRTLTGISTYIMQIQRANERLKDLMADITSSMKAQTSFLTPIIAGIVVGIGIMIVTIMGGLQDITITSPADSADNLGLQGTGVSSLSSLVDLFSPVNIIPSYFFQLIVGLYVLQVVAILSFMSSVVENGPDSIREQSSIGKNLKNTTIFYFLVSLIATLALTILVVVVISGFR